MKRRLLSAVFSVTLALSVFGNSVYASELGSTDVTAIVSEENDVNQGESEQESTEESTETEETEESTEEGTETEETEESTEEGTETEETEESTEESTETEEPGQESTEESTGTEEPGQESIEESTETEEPVQESTEAVETEQESTEEATEETTETEETEETAEESTEESAETEDSAETDETEAVEESEEEISEEEITEVFNAVTTDGWRFTVSSNYATIMGYTGTDTVLEVPSVVRDSSTNNIYKVVAIGYAAFQGVGITAVTLPDSVTSIGGQAFYNCTELENISMGAGVVEVGDYAFANSGIRSIIFPSTVETIGTGALAHCDNLGTIELKCQVTSVPVSFANGCSSLASVVLGDKVTEIGTNAFANTPRLKAISVTSNINKINYAYTNSSGAFYNTGLSNGGVLYCPRGSYADGANAYYIGASSISYSSPTVSKPTLEVIQDTDYRGVLMSCDTEGAIIYYNIDNGTVTLESNWVANGNGLDFSFSKGTIYAKAYMCGQWSDTVSVTLEERKVPQPTFTVKGVFGGRNVTFNAAQSGAVIYYSTKGSTDITTSSAKAANGETVLFENFYGSVYAKTYYDGHWSAPSRLILKIPVVNDPVITYSGDKVTISTTTPNAFIYYTTDGSTPSISNGKRLSGSKGTFTLPGGNGTVKAIAVRSCFTNSSVVTKKVVPLIDSSIKVPSFKVEGVIGGRSVTFNTEQPGAVIYYSTTSSNITTSDHKVNSGESVTFSNYYGTVYARTYSNGRWSNVSRLILKIPVVNQPTITYNGEGYYTIKTTTPDSMIYYTVDGSTPSPTNGRLINASAGKIYGGYGTIKAIAVRSCFTNSSVSTYYY